MDTSFLYASCGLLLFPPRLLLWCLRERSPSQNTSPPPVHVRASPPPEHNLISRLLSILAHPNIRIPAYAATVMKAPQSPPNHPSNHCAGPTVAPFPCHAPPSWIATTAANRGLGSDGLHLGASLDQWLSGPRTTGS
jgi:hypothetical protein